MYSVEYHTRHHQLYNCNYSISPWPDKLTNTYRIDLPEAYAKVMMTGRRSTSDGEMEDVVNKTLAAEGGLYGGRSATVVPR